MFAGCTEHCCAWVAGNVGWTPIPGTKVIYCTKVITAKTWFHRHWKLKKGFEKKGISYKLKPIAFSGQQQSQTAGVVRTGLTAAVHICPSWISLLLKGDMLGQLKPLSCYAYSSCLIISWLKRSPNPYIRIIWGSILNVFLAGTHFWLLWSNQSVIEPRNCIILKLPRGPWKRAILGATDTTDLKV